MAKVQVKHIVHYLDGLFSWPLLSWICFVCICVCILSARELLFFLQRDKIVFAFAFTHAFNAG